MGVDIHKTETRCSQLNRDNACAIISCIIEMNFVHTMLDLLIENQVNTTNVHSLGFDPSDSCKSTGLLPHEMEGYRLKNAVASIRIDSHSTSKGEIGHAATVPHIRPFF